MSRNPASDAPTTATAPTATATRAAERRRWEGRAVVAVIAGIIIVLLVGWIINGLPGLKRPNVLNVVLLLVAIVSGGLTVIFVFDALRKARLRQHAKRRDMLVVLVASLITAGVAIIEMIQAFQELPH